MNKQVKEIVYLGNGNKIIKNPAAPGYLFVQHEINEQEKNFMNLNSGKFDTILIHDICPLQDSYDFDSGLNPVVKKPANLLVKMYKKYIVSGSYIPFDKKARGVKFKSNISELNQYLKNYG